MTYLDFSNQTIAITGATGHLGRKFCQAAARLNARMILIDRDADQLKAFQEELSSINDIGHLSYPADLISRDARDMLVSTIQSSGVALDTLVNNAAYTGQTEISGWNTSFENQNAEAFAEALEVNLVSAFELSQKLYPLLKRSNSASILNVASIYGHLGPDYLLYADTNMQNPAAYGASKAGLIQLTRWLAVTMGPLVRVNAISPGGIYRQQDPRFVDRYTAKTPLKRMAKENDIVEPMLFLISTMARYISGETLVVDGGYSCS